MTKRILIADDDDTVISLQMKLLEHLGYSSIMVAKDGFEVLRCITEVEPDVIFLDINMTGLDGWVVCEILNGVKRWRHIPIVFQAATTDPRATIRALELGACAYIQKPITRENLNAVLASLFHPQLPYPTDIHPHVEHVVQRLVGAVEHTLNFILGIQKEQASISDFDDFNKEEVWDYVARVPGYGIMSRELSERSFESASVGLQISFGWSKELALEVAQSLEGLDAQGLNEERIARALEKVISNIINGTLKSVEDLILGKSGSASIGLNSPVPVDQEAEQKCVLNFTVSKWTFPIVITAYFGGLRS